jgi:PAS domain S-box-containing protein
MRILIAEDNPSSLVLLATLLRKDGHEVVEVSNGTAAWEALQQPGAPELAILDWMMPEMDGLEVVRRVRAQPTVRPPYLIMLSAKNAKADIVAALEDGANDYLAKPFDSGELKARVAVGRHAVEMQTELVDMNADLLQMREDLLETEWKFQALFAKGPIGVAYHEMIYDASGKSIDYRFLDANKAYRALTGVDPRGKTVREAFPGIENDPFDWIGTYGHVARMGGQIRFEQHLQSNDRWYDCVAYQYKPDHFVAAFNEITERKRAEEALKRTEARINKMLINIDDVIVIIDRDGINRYKSPNVERLFGWKLEELVGVGFLDNVHPDDLEGTRRFIDSIMREPGASGMQECRYGCKSGSYRWIEFSGLNLLHDPDILGFLGDYHDITQRKESEALSDQLKAQVMQLQKMESIGRLAGGVAHDFNNMLGVIIGHTELALEEEAGPDSPIHANLQEILTAAVRSADLTRQLLTFSRQQPISPKDINLSDAIAGMLKMLNRLIGENIQLNFVPGKDLWLVKMDSSQIDQVLTNLCVNARDAIVDVGTITIETNNCTLDEGFCAAHAEAKPGGYVRLTVSDTGSGMDKETMNHIFEPFFTTKEMGKGTGLGLATVYGVVSQNGGFIDVCSELDRGTRITIHLPRHLSTAADERVEGAAKPLAHGHETILLVEDEPAILSMMKLVLERQGYTVLAVSTPADAIRLALEHDIHLLMTDVIMPGMNGRELAGILKTRDPHLRVLFMSGYTANVISRHGVLAPGVCFIQKPFTKRDLAVAARAALDQNEDNPLASTAEL